MLLLYAYSWSYGYTTPENFMPIVGGALHCVLILVVWTVLKSPVCFFIQNDQWWLAWA